MRLLRKRVFEAKQHGPRPPGPVIPLKSAPAVCDEIVQTAVATCHTSTGGFHGFVMEVADWRPGIPISRDRHPFAGEEASASLAEFGHFVWCLLPG